MKKIELLILFSYLRYLIIFSHRRNDLVCTAIGVRRLRDDTRANYVFFVTLVFRRVNSFENRIRTSFNLFKSIIESLLLNIIMTFVRCLIERPGILVIARREQDPWTLRASRRLSNKLVSDYCIHYK